MNIQTRVQPGGWKSLPAELKASHNGDFAMNRLAMSGAGVNGIGEIGDAAADAAAIAADIRAASQTILPILVAQSPGTVYTQSPNGQIMVYAQPSGSNQNLPVSVVGGGGGFPNATLTTPLGSATASGISMNTVLVAGGLLALMLFMGKR